MKKPMILIVDDIEINREILKQILEEDYTIIEAGDGLQAVRQIEMYEDSIALILLDIVMPVMNGFKVLENLNNRDLLVKIPVMLITGETSEDISKMACELGVDDVVGKPFDLFMIKRRVKNMIELYEYRNKKRGE